LTSPLIAKVAILSALFCAADAGAQQIKVLPKDSWVNDITPDGEVAVGNYDQQHNSFIWRWQNRARPTDAWADSWVIRYRRKGATAGS